jgi:hypothetical protein
MSCTASTLKGRFLTFIAGGEAKVPFEPLEDTGTYLRKQYISPSALSAVLGEVLAVGVEGFQQWKDYGDRRRRLEVLSDALSMVLIHRSP